eukprot:COSAG05_NODE_3082_length_2338_cov_1.901295_2_plen_70_part_00
MVLYGICGCAKSLTSQVLGELLERGMPTVAYPPGTVPGCPRWGYSVLGLLLEEKSLTPYWHVLHHQVQR